MQSVDELIKSDEYKSMISEILSSPVLLVSKREDARKEILSYMIKQISEAYGVASEDEALDLWEDYKVSHGISIDV
ncbi:MAG: hypothetical protein K2M91_06875 [Lachnospiraceae bacterium]|nr:hypothetical protein [Lachnospiraceae bacterium]